MLCHNFRRWFQAEKIPRLTCHLQVPPEIEDAVRNVLCDDGRRHLKGAKCIVSWIQSLESGHVESVLDYLITTKADERIARFFTDGPTEVQVGYCEAAEIIVEVVADVRNYFVQLQAGVIFGFLACGNAHHANSPIRQNIFGTCLTLLSSPLPDLCIQSAWILGNLACESPAYATKLIIAGVPEILAKTLKGSVEMDRASTNTPQTATIVWTINSLERGAPYLLEEHLVRPSFHHNVSSYMLIVVQRYELITFFVKLLKEEEALFDDIIREICLFFHSCCLEPRWLEALVNADVAPSLIDIVTMTGPGLQMTALQVIGAISASEYDNVLIEAGVFPVLRDVLVAESTLRLAEDACWIMANLTDCTEHVDALIRDVEVPRLLCNVIAEVTNTYEQVIYEVRTREALRVIANVVNHGTPTHIRHLVSKSRCIDPIVGLLNTWNETETLILAIDTLWKMIRQGELDKIPTGDGEVKNIYWALFDIAGGDERLRGLVEHTDSTVANIAANTLAMASPSLIITLCGVTNHCGLAGRDD